MEQLAGTWVLTSASHEVIQKRHESELPDRQQCIIVLAKDGHATFNSLDILGAENIAYVTRQGSWKLEYDGRNEIRIESDQTQYDGDDEYFTYQFSVTKVDGELRIWNYFLDPDLWEFEEYQREKQD